MPRSPLLTIRCTDDIDDILQRIWASRPELKDKSAATLRLALGALDRELHPALLNGGLLVAPELSDANTMITTGHDSDDEWD